MAHEYKILVADDERGVSQILEDTLGESDDYEVDVASGSGASTRKAIGIKRVRIDEISVDFQYPQNARTSSSRNATTGLPVADALLARFRRKLPLVTV